MSGQFIETTVLTIPTKHIPPQDRASKFNLDLTGMRIHELAVVRWLNSRILAEEGYPIPVVMSKPKNAYADYAKAWSSEGGPFSYLSRAKDRQGRPLHRPHPEPPPYPLISIDRTGWEYDPSRSLSYDVHRHIGWPTVARDVTKRDLGNAYTTYMPQAWKFSYQLNHFANTQTQQSVFIQQWMRGFFMSASEPRTWIVAKYPHIVGKRLVMVTQEGRINDLTEQEPQSGVRVYRTGIEIIVHGWVYDQDLVYLPTLWTQISESGPVSPEILESNFGSQISSSADLRDSDANGILNSANNLPS